MDLQEYQSAIQRFVRYPRGNEREYLALGLVSEVGELSGKFAKRLRGDDVSDADVISECGDLLWFTTMIRTHYGVKPSVATLPRVRNVNEGVGQLFTLATQIYAAMQRNAINPIDLCMAESVIAQIGVLHGVTLEELAESNYRKLADRAERNVIVGSGDKR